MQIRLLVNRIACAAFSEWQDFWVVLLFEDRLFHSLCIYLTAIPIAFFEEIVYNINILHELLLLCQHFTFVIMVIPLTHHIFASKRGRCGKSACHIAPPLRKGRGLGVWSPLAKNAELRLSDIGELNG